jgi:hypothetical protein
MLSRLGLNAPRIPTNTKVLELLVKEAANFVLRVDLSLQRVRRT